MHGRFEELGPSQRLPLAVPAQEHSLLSACAWQCQDLVPGKEPNPHSPSAASLGGCSGAAAFVCSFLLFNTKVEGTWLQFISVSLGRHTSDSGLEFNTS